MKSNFLIAILLLFSTAISAQKHEVRAVWLTTIGGIDWPRSHNAREQQNELSRTLDQLQRAGINTVLLQTRIRASVIYPSQIEPFDMCLTGRHGQSPGYDPLRFAIDECHRRGMELHAWVVTLPAGKLNEPRYKEFVKKNPQLVKRVGDTAYLNPEDSRTGDYLARICSEIVKNYDVDGVHLDYCRYPDGWKIKIPRSKARANITAIVQKIHQAVKCVKPWVKLSASPVGKYDDLSRYRSGGWNAYTAVCQDAQGWLRQGLMDQLYPMIYFRDNQFFPFALDWLEHSYGRTIAAGLGIYFLDPREGRWQLSDVTRQLSVLRSEGIGQCYFRSRFLTDNVKGIYDYVCTLNSKPALVPPMTWAAQPKPQSPTGVCLHQGLLWWQGAVTRGNSPYLTYNIYASQQYPVDTSQPENLVAVRYRGEQLKVIPGLNYAVCAVDRYGQESQPCQTGMPRAGTAVGRSRVILTDGHWLGLPQKGATLDADYVAIETLQGQLLMTLPYRGNRLNISQLPDGIYQLKSIGRRGVTHRLTTFAIKRK